MPCKDKDAWRKRKLENPEQWKKGNKIYSQRYRLRNQLRKKAEDLTFKIQGSYLVKRSGLTDKLMEEVAKILKLPYCWDREDYDHAIAKLNKVEEEIATISNGKKDHAGAYHKCLEVLSVLAPDDPQLKLTIAYDMFCKAAVDAMGERVDDREMTDVNFLSLLVTRPDGYYPKWFPDKVVDKLNHMLCAEDLLKISDGLKKCVADAVRARKEREFVEAALGDIDGEDPDEVR